MSPSLSPVASRAAYDFVPSIPARQTAAIAPPPRLSSSAAAFESNSGSARQSAYWSISTTVSPEALSLATTEDAQALSAAVAETASLGMRRATGLVGDIRAALVAAKAEGADRASLGARIEELKQQVRATVEESGFAGRNWLKTGLGETPKISSMVASVGLSGEGDVAIDVLDIDTARTTLVAEDDAADGLLTRTYAGISRSGAAFDYALLSASSAGASRSPAREVAVTAKTGAEEIGGMILAVDGMLTGMQAGAGAIAASTTRIGSSVDLLTGLGSVGGGGRIDVELDAAEALGLAANIQALLQTSGLNIANASMARALGALA